MSWKVLVTARTFKDVGGPAMDALKSAGCDVIVPPKFGPLAENDVLPLLEGVDATLCSPDEYSKGVLTSPKASALKILSRWGVGYDSIDVAAATQQGVVVTFLPGFLNETVADYTFALLLALARRVHEGHAWMAKGDWKLFWGRDVSGKTLGIVGCGRIGLAVARRAAGFSMRLLGYDPAGCPAADKHGLKMVSLDELLAQSDFVTLHAALSPQSQGLLSEQRLRQMKPTAYLINAGRGALVDELGLVRALQEGWIAGAAVDTYTQEPLPSDHPLRYASNVLVTPHLASFARETGERVSLKAAEAILDLMNGRKPEFAVNPEVFSSPALRASLK